MPSRLNSDEKPAHVFFYRNAGGRTSDLTSEMVKTCQSVIGIETCMHLTCTNMPKEKVDIALTVGSFLNIPAPLTRSSTF
jgi:5,10-methylenetetrahydrofolate reductase